MIIPNVIQGSDLLKRIRWSFKEFFCNAVGMQLHYDLLSVIFTLFDSTLSYRCTEKGNCRGSMITPPWLSAAMKESCAKMADLQPSLLNYENISRNQHQHQASTNAIKNTIFIATQKSTLYVASLLGSLPWSNKYRQFIYYM